MKKGKHKIVKKSNPCEKIENPPVMIYDEVLEIIARKGQDHNCDASCLRANHTYRHIFKNKRWKKHAIYGNKNGSLTIK
jgi:hypothetical protein